MAMRPKPVKRGIIYDSIVQKSKEPEHPTKQVLDYIRRAPLKAEEMQAIYSAITNRLGHKTCSKCGKIRIAIEGELRWMDGDMSKPKQFVCSLCV